MRITRTAVSVQSVDSSLGSSWMALCMEADVLYKRAVPAMLCFEFAGGSLQEDWPSIPELFSRRQTSPSILCER